MKSAIEHTGTERPITLSGQPYELGRRHGERLKAEIIRFVCEYVHRSGAILTTPFESMAASARRMEPHIEPELLEEMRGIADGSGVAFDDILALNAISDTDLIFASRRTMCINIVAFGPASKAAPAGLGPFQAGGSASTVNAAEYAPAAPYAVRLASTYRFAVDAASLDRSLSALAPGQSEHPGHPHYADALRPWLEGRSHVLATAHPLVEQELSARLVLESVP